MNKFKKILRYALLSAGLLLPQQSGEAATKKITGEFNAVKNEILQKKDFPTWLKELKAEAIRKGYSKELVDTALPDDTKYSPRVVDLDRKQPEKTRTIEEYLNLVINQKRIDNGIARLENYGPMLDSVTTGVDPEVVVALWGLETNFGGNTGNFNIIPALATLAYDGRRSEYFREELFKALEIVAQGHIPLEDFKGSWAGAMGQVQFMPSSFFAYAKDGDGDGKKDIWKNHADIFASAANYLKKVGWKDGESWGHRVEIPEGIDRSLLSLDVKRPADFWRQNGVKLAGGGIIPDDGSATASVIQPDGPGGAAFIVYDNYRVIRRWNKSNHFATSVGTLSDKIRAK